MTKLTILNKDVYIVQKPKTFCTIKEYNTYNAIQVTYENRKQIYNNIDSKTHSYRYFPIIFQKR